MKKIIVIALLLCVVFSGVVFAADWTVKSIKGTVSQEVSPGQFEAVKVGDVLNDSARVKIGLETRVDLTNGSRNVKLETSKTGTLDKLIADENAGKSSIKVGKNKVSSAGAIKVQEGTKSISSGSTRASEATSDVEWVMEE